MRLLGSFALIAGLLVVGVLLWLHTAMGRGWVERELAREVHQQLALTLTVGRTRGNLLHGIRFEQVELHDVEGRLVARADVVSAHYRLDHLIRRHEIDELSIVRPVVVRVPSVPRGPSPAAPPKLAVHALRISDGSFHWHDHDVSRLSANLALHSGAASAGAEGEVQLTLDEHQLVLRSKAERDDVGVRVSAELKGAAFSARGKGHWADGRLDAKLEALDLDPKLLASARPLTGRGVLHARGTAAGPLETLRVKLHGHSDDRGLALGALVDVPRRTARLSAFVAAPKRGAGLHARATLNGDALELVGLAAHTGTTRLAGDAQVEPRALKATLRARLGPAEAALVGIQPAGPIRVRAALHGPVRALDVRLDGRLRAAQVALTGRVDLRARRGRVRFVAHEVRPSDIVPDAPELAFSGDFTFDGALRKDVGLAGDMSVTDGSLRALGQRFERLHGVGRVQLAQPGWAQVETLSGQLAARRPRPLVVRTTVRWDGRALRFDTSHVVLDENRATGEVVYHHDPVTDQPRLDIRARTLLLTPALVEEALRLHPEKAWPGHATLVWTPDGYNLGFALDTERGRAEGSARFRHDGDALEVSSAALSLGDSRLRGAARFRHGEIVAAIDELLVQPSLLRSIWPTLEPVRTLRIQGAVAGPPHALDLHLIATAGASTAKLRGQVDLPQRSFRLVASLDTFSLESIKQASSSRVNLALSLAGRLVEGGVQGTLLVRHISGTVDGVSLETGRVNAKLDGPRFDVKEALVGVPGAFVDGKGGGTYRDFNLRYGVVITDSRQLKRVPQVYRLMLGLNSLAPGRSVVGAIKRKEGGKVEVTHHVIPAPLRVVNLIFHLMWGDLPRFKVD